MDKNQKYSEDYPISENQESQMPEPEDALENDFSKLESQDPSLNDNHKLIYEKEVPMDLNIENNEKQKNISSFEPIKCKILEQKNDKNSNKIRVELSCENDLFFHFTSDVNENIFNKMKNAQNLTAEFKDYSSLLIRLFDSCIQEPQVYVPTFIMKKNGTARLEIVKESEYKSLELLNVDFINSPDDVVKKQMIYRFSSLKSKINYNKNRIQVAGDVIMSNNPDILNNILDCYESFNSNMNFGGKNLCAKNFEQESTE